MVKIMVWMMRFFLEVDEQVIDEVAVLMKEDDKPCCSYKTPTISFEKANRLWSIDEQNVDDSSKSLESADTKGKSSSRSTSATLKNTTKRKFGQIEKFKGAIKREKKTTDLMMDIVKNEDGSIQLVPIQDKQKKKIKTKSQSSRKLLIKKVTSFK